MASCVPSPVHNYIMQRSVGSGTLQTLALAASHMPDTARLLSLTKYKSKWKVLQTYITVVWKLKLNKYDAIMHSCDMFNRMTV